MEVLQGNESIDAAHARRAADGVNDARRALDWASRPSDILLFPHSPLALADVLSHPAGRFDLKPVPPSSSAEAIELSRENALAGDTDDAPVVSFQQRRRRRHPRERVNLLTRHGDAELLERCRQILVENALVKNRGERQLFLAAGFLGWSDPADAARRRRAPLLLYPVLLVRRPEEPASCYELRLDGGVPIGNASLVTAIRDAYGIELPASDPGVPLADQLARIASLIADTDTLSLDFDIALGNADLLLPAPKSEPMRLPPLPPRFDRPLASAIVSDRTLVELHGVVHLLPDFSPPPPETTAAATARHGARPETAPSADAPRASSPTPPTDISRLREYAVRLAAEGLDQIEFRHLEDLSRSLARWRDTVAQGLATESVATLVGDGSIGARHLVRLAGIIELVDKAPLTIEQYAHPDLCFQATVGVLRRARHQARLIEDELSALQDWFLLDKVPAKRQLLSLIEELGGSVGVEPDIVDADYFNARRQFMEFSIEKPANLTPEHRRLLGQLAKVLRFRELFVNNTEYRSALGPGYRGLRTDWEALESIGAFAVELGEVLESETLAAAALAGWPLFRRAVGADLETLQHSADATRRLLRIGGMRWRERPIGELLAHTVTLGERLDSWHEEYGDVVDHQTRTPAALLARFTGHEREDLLMEIRVGEARARLDARLLDGTSTTASVIDTLDWLREASDVATRHALGVESILAALQPV